jgi:C1A family cysteine protease
MSGFTFERADGSKRCVQGYKYATPKADAKKYSEKRYKEDDLPNKVDLRQHLTPVENQGQTSSCVANATAGAYEYLAKMHTGEDYDVSRMFIYYNGRYLGTGDEASVEDSGCYIQHAIESLKEYGACSEENYPFDLDSVNQVPYQEAYDEAAEFRVEDMALVPTDLYSWKHCLAEGYPIIFGINLYQSFDKQRKKGLVPMPSSQEASRKDHGGHAMLAVGYSDKDKVFIVRNSWGTEWGDDGYCYIPYDYLMNPKFNDGDSWIIKQLNNVDFNNQQYWDDSDESIVGDYDSEIANMSEDDYAAMLDAMGDYPFEYRIALLFLYAASADGDLSDEEYDAIAVYMTATIEKLGVTGMSAEKILRYAVRDVTNITLIQESVQLFSVYFSTEMLAKITTDIESVISVDGISEGETNSIYELIEPWQVQESSEESEEYEESEESVAYGESEESEEYEESEEDEEVEEDEESEEDEEVEDDEESEEDEEIEEDEESEEDEEIEEDEESEEDEEIEEDEESEEDEEVEDDEEESEEDEEVEDDEEYEEEDEEDEAYDDAEESEEEDE